MYHENRVIPAGSAGSRKNAIRLFEGVAEIAITLPLALGGAAQAQSGTAGDEQGAIVVVGSRSGNKALESSAPVQLVSGEDLQATAAPPDSRDG